jgi:hypothetical protein
MYEKHKKRKEVVEEAFEAYCRLLIGSYLAHVILSLGNK